MKKTAAISLLACAALVAGGQLLYRARQGPGAPRARDAAPATGPGVAAAPRAAPADRPPSSTAPRPLPRADAGGGQRAPAKVSAGQVVARVNGVALTGRDVVPFPPGQSEQTVERSFYDALLERAVERELAAQAARKQGIDLSEGQREGLRRLRQSLEDGARREEPGARRVSAPRDAEFAVRQAEGQLLLDALAASAGAPAALPSDADVERYYREHPAAFAPLPSDAEQKAAAWQRIETEIRQTLSTQMQEAHAERLRQLVEQLKAGAQISRG